MAAGYSRELGDNICMLMAEGLSLSEICRMDGMPHRQRVHEWVDENHDGFADRYARAREMRADYFVDELIAIADSVRRNATSEEVQAARLASDNRKWVASKLSGRYGDKVTNVHRGDAENPVVTQINYNVVSKR